MPPQIAPEIKTERLMLRQWTEADRAPFAALNADPQVMEWFPAMLTRSESDALVDRINGRWSADGYGLYAVEVTEEAQFIGFVGLSPGDFDAPFMPAVEVGWRLARAGWGHGYTSEGASAVVAAGFESLGLDEIDSWTAAANQRSRAVMERIGMQRDPACDFEHPRVPIGHPVRPHVLYRLPRVQRPAGRG